MKQRLIVCLLIVGIATLGLFFLSSHPGRPANQAGVQVSKTAAARQTAATPQKAGKGRNTPVTNAVTSAVTLRSTDPSTLVETAAATAALQDFAKWAEEFIRSAASASVVEGQRLAWKRREAMLDLIQSDPAQAIASAAPFGWRQALPPQITRFFEQQLDGRGDLNVAMGTDLTRGSATVYRSVRLAGTNYQAFVYGRRLAQSCQSQIPLHGIALEGKMAVAGAPLRVIEEAEAEALARRRGKVLDKICSVSGNPVAARKQPVYAESGGGILCFCGTDHYDLVNRQWTLAESGGTAGSGETPVGLGGPVNDAWTHGTKTVLYMRVNFPDDLTEPISEGAAYSVMDEVNDFYTVVSYDLTAVDTTVAPLVTLPQTKAYYSADPGLLLTDARATTKLAGYDTDNFDRDIVAFTSVPNYTFGGLAYVGGKGVWLQSMDAGVTAHELGHNYGLVHANFWDATTNYSMVGPGTNLEYGNPWDTMGAAGAGIYQFDAPHKGQLDWLKADAVQSITTNGVYRIYPFDVPASSRVAGRFYAAAVKKDALRHYWLEFRQLFTANPWLENGLLLNWAPWAQSSGGTQLIDTTPGSPDAGDALSRDDAAVVIGRTFDDSVAGVHITPLQRGSSGTDPWIEYQVNLGGFPGNQRPVISLEVDQTNVAVGALVHFHAAASDPNGDTLAYAWTFDDLTFSTNNLSWTSKTFTTAGDHVVRCEVSDMKGGKASANAVVTVGSPGGYRVTGRVTDTDGVPLEGVLVGNGDIDPATFIGGWTDSDGQYVLVNLGATDFSLNAYQFGYTFAPTTWSNPLQPTNDTPGVDFVAAALATVNVSVDTNTVLESDTTAHYFTVTRTGDTNNDLSAYVVLSGTATFGANYKLDTDLTATNLIDIPAGTNSVTFTFHALNNQIAEGPETVELSLLDDLNYTSPGYALAPMASATITILDDDLPAQPSVTVAAATPEISGNGIDLGEFVFTRIGSTQSGLLVNYSVGGTAAPGRDFAPLAGAEIIPAGQSSATVFLQPLDGHSVESNETVVVTVQAGGAYSLGTQTSDAITILNDGLTTVTVFPTSEPAAEPSSPGTFTVKRDGDLTAALTVNYAVGGTAVPNVDYVPLSGSVTIPAGAASAPVVFQPLNDGVLTPDKYVTLSLTNDYNYDAGTPDMASIYITESQRPTVTISAPVNSVSEQGNVFGEFQISRTTTTGNLTVYLALSGTAAPGWNYLPLDNPVVIPDGASSVSLDVIPFQDAILDPTMTVELTVLANTNYNVASPRTAVVDILDDGTSQVPGVGFCFATAKVPESQSPGIAVSLTVTSAVPVSVDYKVVGGTAPASRYSLPAGTLFLPTNGYTAMIPLQIVNDTTVEPPQTIEVVLFNPTNATLGAIRVHTYTILDDDLATISVAATVPNASEAGPVPGNFRLSRAGSTNASQLVNFQITGSASAPADYNPLGTSATIPAGATYVDLPVVPVQDRAPRLTQNVVLTLISATNCAIVNPNVATVAITDGNTNPLPVVMVTSTNQPDAVAGGTNGQFLFTRSGPTTNALSIFFTIGGTASAARYAVLPTSVTITAGQSSVPLPVVALDDHQIEGDKTVVLTLNEAETYQSAYPSSATVTVQDGDQRVWIDASIFDASKYGPIPGQFTFSRFGTTNTPVTIYYTISGTGSNGVDYVSVTNSIIVPAGQSTITLPITPLHNGIVKGPVTVTLTLLSNAAYAIGAPASGTVTIDDDMPMLTITTLVTPVLEGSGSNGVFQVTRTGDPKYDFTAYLAAGGTATYGLDYPPFPTNIYFTCGVTSIDLYITPSNNLVADGDHTVSATLLPNPAYTILSPSNAVLTITDAGTNQTPLVIITNPATYVAFLDGTNVGLVLGATVIDAVPTNDLLTWSEVAGPDSYVFGDTNAANTTVLFTNAGVYQLRLTADNGFLQGHADIIVFVGGDALSATNILHWTLDEGTGTNVADSSGTGRNGIFSGSPAWVTNGAIADALQFFGTNDCVHQSAGSNTLNGLKAFTVALWIKPPATNADRGFLTGDDVDTNATFDLGTKVYASCGDETNVVEANFTTTAGAVHRASASNALKPGQWQHFALTWTNGGEPKLYFNGRLDQPAAGFVAAAGVLTNCPQFIIGKGPLGSPASWTGALDDVRVFDVALSAEEILWLADGPVTNHAPVVNAGTNITVQINTPVTLVGTVTDDGLPNPPGMVTTIWTCLGTNDISIPDPGSLTNTITFTDPGDYVFQLTAFDGQLSSFAQVTVTVIPPTEVDIYADIPDAYDMGPIAGDFTLSRDGDTNDLTVYLAISGTASNSVDYVTITNAFTIPAGSNSIAIPVLPILNYRIKGDQSVIVTIVTNIAYSIGTGQATVTIHDSPYGVWSIAHFTLEELTQPQLSGAGADFSHDGIANFAKYAFNLDPKVVNKKPPYAWDFETDTNDGRLHFTLTYTRILPPRVVQYGVFVSTDLRNWNTGTNYVEDFFSTNNPDGITEMVKTRALTPFPSPTNLFMNIRVWLEQVPGP